MGEQRSHRDVTVAPPKEIVVAKRRVAPGPPDRSTGFPQKQSSPYIRRVQYTVLSVAGLKGTLSEAELHILRARLHGGILNKARRGELQCPLPVGLVYNTEGQAVLDPDKQVQDSLRLFFDTFRRAGSACAVVKTFHPQDLLFPRRLKKGPRKGDLVWAELGHCRVLEILHNPRYAGAFAYGRTRTRKTVDGTSCVKVPSDQWLVIPGAHAGYITWEEFHENQ